MGLNVTPDPRVLLALRYTPLEPLDALCELIDNAVDAFRAARLAGEPVDRPVVMVQVPGPAEIARGQGSLSVRDNGPGMTPEHVKEALSEGFSLRAELPGARGLFGIGFNVATGKLGRRTRYLTGRIGAAHAVSVTCDLDQMRTDRSYVLSGELVPKPADFAFGSIVEVSEWWPSGDPARGVVEALAAYGTETITGQLGRRYATLLREHGVQLIVNRASCEPFEHCVWSAQRAVVRRGLGRIPARFEFDKVLHIQVRCADCNTALAGDDHPCPNCGSTSRRTAGERVHGWVGIQRFDDPSDFGIDLVRHGRAIRLTEQDALFSTLDEFGRTIREYPLDPAGGRIVGEVHLDHVPVDFLKLDFVRSSNEWRRAIAFLRGGRSLASKESAEGGSASPVRRLVQAYGRVNTPGTADLYMGMWDDARAAPRRVSRELEARYRAKFLQRIPGYFEDDEWWKLVESADVPPARGLEECPECHAENLAEAEVCQVCNTVLRGQPCVYRSCRRVIPQSALACPFCGTSQLDDAEGPWTCSVCGAAAAAEADSCARCGKRRGALNPASRECLAPRSRRIAELCVPGLSLAFADGSETTPLDVDVYDTPGPLTPAWQGSAVPLVAHGGERLELFMDLAHPIFRAFRAQPEFVAATAIAGHLREDVYGGAAAPALRGAHDVANLAAQVVRKYWAARLEDGVESLRADIASFFADVRSVLPRLATAVAEDFYATLSAEDQRALSHDMLSKGHDLSKLAEWRRTGEFLRYIEPATVGRLFQSHPAIFFDHGIWALRFADLTGLSHPLLSHVAGEITSQYQTCLDDCAAFLRYQGPDPLIARRVRVSLTFLRQRMV